MKSHYRVVVIGGGIVGTSVLYHLAKFGWTDVALIERAELTSGSTWPAAAGFHVLNDDPNIAALQGYTIRLYEEIERESGQSVGLHMTGGISLAASAERWQMLKAEKSMYETMDMHTRLVTPEGIRELCPIVNVRGLKGGLYDAHEGYMDPHGTQIEQNENATRLADSIETALKLGSGVVLVKVLDVEESLFSQHFACVYCGISLGEIAPRTFSFNSPYGACPTCTGLGCKLEIDPNLVVPDKELSLADGAIQPWMRNGQLSTWSTSILESLGRRHGFSLSTPVKDLSDEQLRLILYGNWGELIPATYEDRLGQLREYYANFQGVIPHLERRYRETSSDSVRADIERYMASFACSIRVILGHPRRATKARSGFVYELT